ncbi:putative receptor-like protein kinase At3g47110 [Camellia sinensis]|uniref:putative receptor-like protein kinase At3g47110 n=1 Tax=Camellia sinensis TaxID=4442 RepID=UPI0010364EC5|nr:putative receptor-like protein kinase At3g47110 [Camellia sinensis]
MVEMEVEGVGDDSGDDNGDGGSDRDDGGIVVESGALFCCIRLVVWPDNASLLILGGLEDGLLCVGSKSVSSSMLLIQGFRTDKGLMYVCLRLVWLCLLLVCYMRLLVWADVASLVQCSNAAVGSKSASGVTTTTSTNTFVGIESDRLALLTFKTMITQDPYGVVNSWNNSNHLCEWKGVRCGHQHKRITIIDLQSRDLVGSLSLHIGNLSFLQELRLNNNTFRGEIPAELEICSNNLVEKFPEELTSLSKLIYLGIHLNNLTGGIPPFIGNLTSLVRITVAYNPFGGSIPNTLGQLKNLSFLGLGVTQLSDLVSFDVGENNFNGKKTNDFGSLQNLREITISDNHFGSKEPDELTFLGSLVNCSNLEKLSMHSNQFTGKIPPSIGNLQKLQRLSFDNNKLSGKIPNSIGNLSLLTELYLTGNIIEGTIPSTQNRLFGSLPTEVGNLKNLKELDISENGLSGEIPSSLGSCTSLENLYLQENFFQGSILSLETLRGIADFDLSHNNLSGKIPTFLEKFSVQKLNLSFNDFEGEVPMKGVFTNVSAISIIGNDRLCGGISELQLHNCITQKSKHKMPLSHILPITVASVLVGGTLVSLFIIHCFKKKRTTHNTIPLLKELFLKISYEKLFKATNGFSSANLIGFGSFGSKYKGILDQDGAFVAAVKVLNLQNRGAAKSFMAECKTLRNIRHRNLVRIITSCSSVNFQGNEFKALVYDCMPSGSLKGWLHSSPKTNNGQNEHRRVNILERINNAIDVACALDYLHH